MCSNRRTIFAIADRSESAGISTTWRRMLSFRSGKDAGLLRNIIEDSFKKSCEVFDITLQVSNSDSLSRDENGDGLRTEFLMYEIINDDITDPFKNLESTEANN
ncbi:hypothetical protein AVEN_26619-1 [Araneus ventricosus]|uniref:Uncharacterized protein n=1 Tax=Araneus ventricosus TaxID=182803 RepID=A0A4Y2GV73_ARAVE|nr:hypothetical protein AVEN_26619-1 [Araneus ventricosus]